MMLLAARKGDQQQVHTNIFQDSGRVAIPGNELMGGFQQVLKICRAPAIVFGCLLFIGLPNWLKFI